MALQDLNKFIAFKDGNFTLRDDDYSEALTSLRESITTPTGKIAIDAVIEMMTPFRVLTDTYNHLHVVLKENCTESNIQLNSYAQRGITQALHSTWTKVVYLYTLSTEINTQETPIDQFTKAINQLKLSLENLIVDHNRSMQSVIAHLSK